MTNETATPGPLALFERAAISDEVAVLRPNYPRPVWPGHANLGETAKFWLQRHAMFREFGTVLTSASTTFREDPADADGFYRWMGPRLRLFLGELHGHHAVEDHHYFPVFRAADARLGAGFDILDADHQVIDGLIHQLAEAGTALGVAVRDGRGGAGEAERLAAVLDRTLAGVMRHLDDEEDIVVPLILDRTESGLGIG